jgi:hypothetical protein
MKPTDFEEAKWLKSFRCNGTAIADREWFLNKYDIIKRFPFPEYYYFKVLNDRCHIHWAIIKEEDNKAVIYFINYRGIVFDKLEYKKVRKAQRELRKNKFIFCTNQKSPYLPLSPVYLRLGEGRKSAPYSKGNLWNFKQKTQQIIVQNIQKGMSIPEATTCLVKEHPELFSRKRRKNWNKPSKKLIERHQLEMEKVKPRKTNINKKKCVVLGVIGGILVITLVFIYQLLSRPMFWIVLFKTFYGD